MLAHNLQAAQLPHRFTDELDRQILLVPNAEVAKFAQQLITLFKQEPQRQLTAAPLEQNPN